MLTRGYVAHDRGALTSAAALFEASLTIVQTLGHTRDIALALAGLGHVARMHNDTTSASALFDKSLAMLRLLGDKVRMASVLVGIGRVHRERGDYYAAAAVVCESLEAAQSVGNALGVAESLEEAAALLALIESSDDGEWSEQAVHLCALASVPRDRIGAPVAEIKRPDHERTLTQLKDTLGVLRFETVWAMGAELTSEQASAEAQRVLRDVMLRLDGA